MLTSFMTFEMNLKSEMSTLCKAFLKFLQASNWNDEMKLK